MTNPPLFSIITVTINNLDGLQNTAASLTKQTCTDFEWIVIDGASSDGTKQWLTTFKNHNFTFASEPDESLYDAMNKGLTKVVGEYILFLNAGDCLALPQTLKKITKHIGSKPDFIYGDALEEHRNGQTLLKKSRPHTAIRKGMPTHHQAMLYKRAKIHTLRYNTAYQIAADYDFTARFLRQTKTAQYLPVPICFFQSGGLSQTRAVKGRTEEFEIKKNLKIGNVFQIHLTRLRQSIAQILKKTSPDLYLFIRKTLKKAPIS